MAEQWIPVVGYEGWYEVSDLGRVRNVKARNGTYAGRILKSRDQGRGYLQVEPCKHGVGRKKYIHLMVSAAFIGPRPEGKQVNHIDGNKLNNDVNNLEYVTASENILHSYRLGLQKPWLKAEDVHDVRRRLRYETRASVSKQQGYFSAYD